MTLAEVEPGTILILYGIGFGNRRQHQVWDSRMSKPSMRSFFGIMIFVFIFCPLWILYGGMYLGPYAVRILEWVLGPLL